MTDPHPLSESLVSTVERIRRKATDPTLVVVDDDTAEVTEREQFQREFSWRSAVPRRFVGAVLDDVPNPAREVLMEWVAHERPPNLLITGPIGSGKSHAAVAVLRSAHFSGKQVRFVPVGEMLDALRPGGPDGEMERLFSVPRLLIDDIGTERPTDWTAERLYAVVNRRWLEERPTIATTNLSPKELEEVLGERTFSRLVGSGAVPLRLGGHDRRRAS